MTLEEFVQWCKEESWISTVEMAMPFRLDDKTLDEINKELEPYGFFLETWKCQTCKEKTDGECEWHLERIVLEK